MLYVNILQQHDELIINEFAHLIQRKNAYLLKLENADIFDFSESETVAYSRKIKFLSQEIDTLTHIANTIIRHLEGWEAPELSAIEDEYLQAIEAKNSEIEFWKSIVEADSKVIETLCTTAYTQAYRLYATDEKLTRYQTHFINQLKKQAA